MTTSSELADAYAEFRKLDRLESAAMQEALDIADRRADAAERVRQLGGKL